MHPSVSLMLRSPRMRAAIERALASRGQHGDSMLAHINPAEAAALVRMGGAGTLNPRTGLPQFYQAGPASGTGGDADALGSGGNAPGSIGGSGRQGEQPSASGVYSPYSINYAVNAPAAPAVGAGAANGGNNTPSAAPPVTLSPFMSKIATTDLTGGRFGPLPAWATTPYQVGVVPDQYPTPGVNTGIGWGGGGLSFSGSLGLPAQGRSGEAGGLGGLGGMGQGGTGLGRGSGQFPGPAYGAQAFDPQTGVINPTLYQNMPIATLLERLGTTPAQVESQRTGMPVGPAPSAAAAQPASYAQQVAQRIFGAGTGTGAAAGTTAPASPPNAPFQPEPPALAANPYAPGTAAWTQWRIAHGLAATVPAIAPASNRATGAAPPRNA